MNKLLKYFIISVLIIIISSVFIFKKFYCNRDKNGTYIYRDTSLIARYEKDIGKDTVIKWHEKIIYKKSEPEIVYYQKTDTVFIEKIKTFDLMLQVRKKDNKLIIKAVNPEGMILKEYLFDNVNNDFVVTSRAKNLFVKSARFKWEGINTLLNMNYPFSKDYKTDYSTGIGTGFSFNSKLKLNTSLNYSITNKTLFLNTELKIKF